MALACTESDPNLVQQVGVTLPLLVDSSLAPQSVTDPEVPIQVAEWQLQAATLQLGQISVSLVEPGTTCSFFDTTKVLPVGSGKCAKGVVIDSSAAQPARLTLNVSQMRVRRAVPVTLTPADDFDGDGVVNGSDNCPLLPNPDQADGNADHIGDACSAFDFTVGTATRDSDGDGVIDRLDNCVWKANPLQEDTQGLAAEHGLADGIGDACAEQVASVRTTNGDSVIQLDLNATGLAQPLAARSFLTVDFGQALVNCDWIDGTCTLDVARVRFCPTTSVFQALSGCP